MFGFNHSKRVGDAAPRAVMMQRSSNGPGSTHGDVGASPPAALPVVSDALEFKVRYGLGEYIVFMWQHSGYLIRRRRVGAFTGLWMTIKSTWGAAINFVLQRRARHLYEFTIDEHGIVRTNGVGVTLVPWSDVSAIRRYSRGYMMVLKRGTLPIPFRCLDERQMQAMGRFAASVKEAARALHAR